MSHLGEGTYTNVADRSERHGKGCRPRRSCICCTYCCTKYPPGRLVLLVTSMLMFCSTDARPCARVITMNALHRVGGNYTSARYDDPAAEPAIGTDRTVAWAAAAVVPGTCLLWSIYRCPPAHTNHHQGVTAAMHKLETTGVILAILLSMNQRIRQRQRGRSISNRVFRLVSTLPTKFSSTSIRFLHLACRHETTPACIHHAGACLSGHKVSFCARLGDATTEKTSSGCSLMQFQRCIQEKLRFPSGTATAKVIRMLHGGPTLADDLDGPVDSRRELPPVLEEVCLTDLQPLSFMTGTPALAC